MQQLAGEGHEDGLICHIFLECLPAEYHYILAVIGVEAPIEKLATLADNIADPTSHRMVLISSKYILELANSMEGLKSLEVQMA